MRNLAIFAATAFVAGALAPRAAEACSCNLQARILEPTGGSIPFDGKLLGTSVQGRGAPNVVAFYIDRPNQTPIPGTVTIVGTLDYHDIWMFVPTSTLTFGRTIRVNVSSGTTSELSVELFVGVEPLAPGRTFAGVTRVQAIKSNIVDVLGGGSCAPDRSPQNRMVLPNLPPPDSASPIYRYYFYQTPGEMPQTPSAYGVREQYLSNMRCGNPTLLCEPWTTLFFEVGQTFCVRVEAEDLLGNRSGYSSEACTTVTGENVDAVSEGGSFVFCVPHGQTGGEDGGVADDSGATGPGGPDTGTGGGGGGNLDTDSGGCNCSTAHSTRGSVVLFLIFGLLARRRWRAPCFVEEHEKRSVAG